MPASLFAAWAGRPLLAEYTNELQPSDTVFAPGLELMAPIGAPNPVQPVTEVADPFWTGLRQNTSQNQCGIRRNPGSLDKTVDAAGLDAGDPIAWRALFDQRVAHRSMSGNRTEQEAEVLAFGDCIVEWHRRHGASQHPDRCAGCAESFIDSSVLDFGRGARVHFDLSCLTRYGQAWRSAAGAGLHALGIEKPAGFELL